MLQIATIRERDFAEFLQYAAEEELMQHRQVLDSELSQRENVRSRTTDLMRDRLSRLDQTLGLAD